MTPSSSINQAELNKFSRNHEQWWDEQGEFKTLHDINPIRVNYITQKIQQHFNISKKSDHPLKNLNIIDIGCGGGLVSVPMCKLGANVVGLDANENNIKAATDYAKKHNLNISFICNSVEDYLAKQHVLYDVVLCMEVIEHVDNTEEFLLNLTKLLKPNGLLILSTINRTIQSYMQAILMAEYVLRWVPTGTHDYAKFIKPSELKNMLQGTKWQLQELKGLKLNVIDSSWYLSDDIDVNYFACIAYGKGNNVAHGAI